MKRFVEGIDRGQATLFPKCLEDWIDEDNPVRVMMPLLKSSTYRGWVSMEWPPRQQADPHITPLCC